MGERTYTKAECERKVKSLERLVKAAEDADRGQEADWHRGNLNLWRARLDEWNES